MFAQRWLHVGNRTLSRFIQHPFGKNINNLSVATLTTTTTTDHHLQHKHTKKNNNNYFYRMLDTNTPFIDSHCHLDLMTVAETADIVEYATKSNYPLNYEGCIAIFCHPDCFDPANVRYWGRFARSEAPKVWISGGVHPHDASKYNDDVERAIDVCMAHPQCVAWGECGLDYFRMNSPQDIQMQVFARQLQRAVHHGKPVVVHTRQADEDTLKIMKENLPTEWRIHVHCFTAGGKFAKELLDNFPNLRIGFTGVVTFKNSAEVQETIRTAVPVEKILLETDAPYMSPRRGQEANASDIPTIAAKIAQLKGIDVETVLQHSRQNTRLVYGI